MSDKREALAWAGGAVGASLCAVGGTVLVSRGAGVGYLAVVVLTAPAAVYACTRAWRAVTSGDGAADDRRAAGEDGPDAASAPGSLSLKTAEAEVDALTRALGPEHPDTLACRDALVKVMEELGEWDIAATEMLMVARVRAQVLGNEHPETLANRHTAGLLMAAAQHFEQAEAMHRMVLEARSRVLGEEHPDTLSSRYNLARVLGVQGKLEEAEAENRTLYEVRRRMLGEEHPDTLAGRYDVARVLAVRRKLEEAEREHRAVLEARSRVLGEEHPDTRASRLELDVVRLAIRASALPTDESE
ncbi:tetratricopeptide repeat protein [Nonomuraea longispora]|uniref:Tetratricopeptide repeat protein n=1 Tax=Nonomuraea longispora TaxID=1848320 RepID=A0A4V2XL59_9ACTN|nr:tetratricopeptide repeat protein [Nonomuraea longispora]TDC09156.1 tetratricopeptide repeat protein [Nonomuraea longispora]